MFKASTFACILPHTLRPAWWHPCLLQECRDFQRCSAWLPRHWITDIDLSAWQYVWNQMVADSARSRLDKDSSVFLCWCLWMAEQSCQQMSRNLWCKDKFGVQFSYLFTLVITHCLGGNSLYYQFLLCHCHQLSFVVLKLNLFPEFLICPGHPSWSRRGPLGSKDPLGSPLPF